MLLRLAYWPIALIPLFFILGSLGYPRVNAILIGLTFIPCALLLRWLLPKVLRVHSFKDVLNLVFVMSGIFVSLLLMILVIHFVISVSGPIYREYQPLPVLTSPFFLALLLGATALGNYYWNCWLNRMFSTRPELITFISDRHGVSVLKSDILYVESRDSEVWIHTRDGRRFRNKTPITQWENLLGDGYIRIHRAFLVAEGAISEHLGDAVRVGEQELPVSRKYYDIVSSICDNPRFKS